MYIIKSIVPDARCRMQGEGLHRLQKVTWVVATNDQHSWLELDGLLFASPKSAPSTSGRLPQHHPGGGGRLGLLPTSSPSVTSLAPRALLLDISHLAPTPAWIQVTQAWSTSLCTCYPCRDHTPRGLGHVASKHCLPLALTTNSGSYLFNCFRSKEICHKWLLQFHFYKQNRTP